MTSTDASPVLVTARLDSHLSRWLWLFKWLLALPHFLVLAVLWPVFVVTSVFAAVAIVATGRYPRSLFELNAGVLRWTWRVHYYSYGALATDQYPPFTLRDVPDYPARLQIAYPEHLSRGLVFVKWWLLALPHYLVVSVLLGGGWWAFGEASGDGVRVQAPGLIGILVLVAGVVLAFSGRYPSGLFDLVVGLDRWVLRVGAYAGLMTDEYPPFRLDMGGQETRGGVLLVDRPASAEPGPPPPANGRYAGGTVAVVLGALLLLPSLGLLAGGVAALWADQTQRDDAGYVTSSSASLETSTRALVTEPWELDLQGPNHEWLRDMVGDVRLRVTGTSGEALFVGVGPTAEVEAYLADVGHAVVREIRGSDDVRYQQRTGGAVQPPTEQSFWTVSDVGIGTRSLLVPTDDGRWTAVVMNPDGSRGVSVRADVGATVPGLPGLAGALVVAGVLFAVGAAVLLAVGARQLSGPRSTV